MIDTLEDEDDADTDPPPVVSIATTTTGETPAEVLSAEAKSLAAGSSFRRKKKKSSSHKHGLRSRNEKPRAKNSRAERFRGADATLGDKELAREIMTTRALS